LLEGESITSEEFTVTVKSLMEGEFDPTEFADMVVDLFLYGFAMPVPAKDAARPLRQRA